MSWHTILAAHDFSDGANAAWQLACDLARLHGARLVLAHVDARRSGLVAAPLLVPDLGAPALAADEYALISARRKLEAIAREVACPGLHVEVVARAGPVVDTLLALVGEVGADAVVMGTHGRKGISHLLMGSVAEKVVRGCPVPVVTVRVSESAAREAASRLLEKDLEGTLRGTW
jgi:universal stress protein A